MILCDEPTGALDFQTSIQVLQLLADSLALRQNSGDHYP